MTQEITFWVLAVTAVLGALVAVQRRNLIHGVFALMIFFAALSGLFLLLLAEFIAARTSSILAQISADREGYIPRSFNRRPRGDRGRQPGDNTRRPSRGPFPRRPDKPGKEN